MEIENLFTDQKWAILSALSKGKWSPLQLAEKSKTTMANISQQLRLLEFSNLVKKEKIPNRDKGKPRTLFSLSYDYVYIISLMDGFAEKKLIKVDKFHSIVLRTLFLNNQDLHYYIIKFLLEIEEHLNNIDVMTIRQSEDTITMIIASKNPKDIEKKLKDATIKRANSKSISFKIKVVSIEQLKKLYQKKEDIFSSPADVSIICDSNREFSKLVETGVIMK